MEVIPEYDADTGIYRGISFTVVVIRTVLNST